MSTVKLKVSINGQQFEVEGSPEIVRQLYEAFLKTATAEKQIVSHTYPTDPLSARKPIGIFTNY